MSVDQTISLTGGQQIKVKNGQAKNVSEAIRHGDKFAEVKDTDGNKVAIAVSQIVAITEARDLRKADVASDTGIVAADAVEEKIL